MQQSLLDTEIWQQELELMSSQEHFEEVWQFILPSVSNNIDQFIEDIIQSNPSFGSTINYRLFKAKLIDSHGITASKYGAIFSDDNMEEYEQDVDSFKSIALKKECDVIRNSLNSKSESLNEWKKAFFRAKAQEMYDTFRNILDYTKSYDKTITEESLSMINTIDEIGFKDMDEAGCYLPSVFGTGIVSNITNHLFPRIFPGHFKLGVYSLYFISNGKIIEMPSETSEFLMIKDKSKSKTNIIEADHNYFFPYETFSLYSLRISRLLNEAIIGRFDEEILPNDRYVMLNAFYEFVFQRNRDTVSTLAGNDDILKFGYTF